ncbi:MAG: vanadium nitrogenase [Lachnospiraceae bacterium]|nr:vanadium nitrogenase [Lachnospiraceae bacterium]MDE7436155.1 vanadium nitrogenase [Lachnospiraceae bacterium]
MIAFAASFIQYFLIFVVLVALAVAGTMIGIALRKRKDAKESNMNNNDEA